MGNRWLRLGMLAAGCFLLLAGCRLLYLIHRGDPGPDPYPVRERVVRPAPVQPPAPAEIAPAEAPVPPGPPKLLPTPPPAVSIVTSRLPMGEVGVAYSYELEATGVRGLVVWTLAERDLPPGLALSPEGMISGVPEEAGEWRFTVRLVERGGAVLRRELTLLIRDPEVAEAAELEIGPEALPPGSLGRNYLVRLEAAGGVPPYIWSLDSGELPEGIRFDPDSAVLSGVPREMGEFELTFSVVDREEDFAERDYALRVEESGVEIITAALPPTVRGESYHLTLRARGGSVPYAWELIEGRLPEGLDFDPDRGIISGVPEKWEAAELAFRVTDREGRSARRGFELAMATVEPGGLRIVTGSLPPASRGEVYWARLEAAEGWEPYTWTVSEGELPPGLFLDPAAGEIGGLPEQSGRSGFTVMVSDRFLRTARQSFNLVVDQQVVRITTSRLPAATAGEEYQYMLEATGGNPPYFFSLDSGRLPLSLALSGSTGLIDGVVSDMYFRQGDRRFRFRVRAVDRDDNLDTVELTLKVSDPFSPARRASGREVTPRPFPDSTPAGPEEGIGDLIGSAGDSKVGLAWKNPSGSDFGVVRVVRNAGDYPRDPGDGEVVYTGRGDNIVDTGLENRNTYFYAVVPFSRDGTPGEIDGSNRISLTPRRVSLFGPADPYADEVVAFQPLTGAFRPPSVALGPPDGVTVPLQAEVFTGDRPAGGRIVLRFTDNMVVNGAGADFTVFGKVVDLGAGRPLLKPAVVDVSQDGRNWVRFPFFYRPGFRDGEIDFYNPYSYQYGFAGINPVHSRQGFPDPTDPAISGGDHFDLDDLPGRPFRWIQYVRITAAGDGWLLCGNGNLVRHTTELGALSGRGSSGFELDAVSAINY